MSHYNVVHKPIPIPTARAILEAKAAGMDKIAEAAGLGVQQE